MLTVAGLGFVAVFLFHEAQSRFPQFTEGRAERLTHPANSALGV